MADLEIEITDDNEFIVYEFGKEVYRSRAFRLRVQAEQKAAEYINQSKGIINQGDTLEVQNLSVDTDYLLGGHNGKIIT